MSDGDIIKGLPSMCLLPATDYELIWGQKDLSLVVPKKGNFEELLSEDDELGREYFQGDFVVYDDEFQVFYPHVLNKVLLAMRKYPGIHSHDGKFPIFSVKAVIPDGEEITVLGDIVNIIVHD